MKKQKLSILALAVVFFAASCKKTDLQQEVSAEKSNTTAVVASDWKSVSAWTASKEEKSTSYSGKISDSTVSSNVAASGMVLVYMKSGNKVTTLPSSEGDVYWYYQVSENQIDINAEAYGASQEVNNTSAFRYFVLGADKLKSLESQGYSKADLMTLTYENASTLLK